MKSALKKSTLSLALAASLIGSAAWSTASYACSTDSPMISSICIMAAPRTQNIGQGSYVLANGTQLPVNSYAAMFSLLGNTYGGDGKATFNSLIWLGA